MGVSSFNLSIPVPDILYDIGNCYPTHPTRSELVKGMDGIPSGSPGQIKQANTVGICTLYILNQFTLIANVRSQRSSG